MSDDSTMRPVRSSTRGAKRGLRRSKTLSVKKLTPEEIRDARYILETFEEFRPKKRSDCKNAPRPCPWVSCKYHLYLDIGQQKGSIKQNFPDLEVWEMTETCALDVADRGGITLEDVGLILNLTRERIRQLERSGIEKLQNVLGDMPDEEFDEEDECIEFDADEDF